MKRHFLVAVFVSILTLYTLIHEYERHVKLWSASQVGAVFRFDVFIVYPLIIGLSLTIFYGVYYFLNKYSKPK